MIRLSVGSLNKMGNPLECRAPADPDPGFGLVRQLGQHPLASVSNSLCRASNSGGSSSRGSGSPCREVASGSCCPLVSAVAAAELPAAIARGSRRVKLVRHRFGLVIDRVYLPRRGAGPALPASAASLSGVGPPGARPRSGRPETRAPEGWLATPKSLVESLGLDARVRSAARSHDG